MNTWDIRYSEFSNSPRMISIAEQACVSGMSLLVSVLVGRNCGMESLAVYSLTWSVLMLLIGVQTSVVGIPYTVRVHQLSAEQLALYRGGSLTNFALLIIGCSTLLTLCIVALSTAGGNQRQLVLALVCLTVGAPFILLRELSRRWAFAHFQPNSALRLTLLIAGFQVLFLIATIYANVLNAALAIASFGVSASVFSTYWLISERHSIAWRWSDVKRTVAGDWRLGRWMLCHQVFATLNMYCVLWLCRWILPESTGILASYITLSSLANPILLGVINSATPQFAAAKADATSTHELYWRTATWLGLLMLAFFVCYLACGERVAGLLYGRAELQGQTILIAILGLRVVVAAFGVCPHLMLTASQSPYKSSLCVALGLLTSCSLGIPLAYAWGLPGLALGWLIGIAVESTAFLCTVPTTLQTQRQTAEALQ